MSLKTNHWDRKQYICILRNEGHGHLCLAGLVTAASMALHVWWAHQTEDPFGALLGGPFGIWPHKEDSSVYSLCFLTLH